MAAMARMVVVARRVRSSALELQSIDACAGGSKLSESSSTDSTQAL